MSQTQQDFYQQKEANKQDDLVPRTLLEKCHRLLQRYEYHRSQAVLDLLPHGKKILDIGFGNGDFLIQAHKKGYRNLFGIDISPHNYQVAIKNHKQKSIASTLILHNIDTKTKLKSNTFDTITMIAVLEHVFDVNFVLSEVNRLLRHNGTLIIEVPNLAFLPRRLQILLGILPKTGDGENDYHIGHLHHFTVNSLSQLLAQHGFRIKSNSQSGIAYRLRQLSPSLLGANIIIKAVKTTS